MCKYIIAINRRYLSEGMKKWLHLKSYLISLVLLIIASNLFSQPIANCGHYYKYEFESFLENKTKSARDYYREIHRVIKYPSSARATKSEGVIRVMILNHSNNNYEIIAINYIESLSAAALEAVETAHAQFANISGEKYITELTIEFEYQLDE